MVAWPTWAAALPAVMGTSGLIHSTGAPGAAGPGESAGSSLPVIWSRRTSYGVSATFHGSNARASASPTRTVTPGNACTASQCAPRARRDTFRIRPSIHAATSACHSPSGSAARGSRQTAIAAAAAASSSAVREGGVAFSMRSTMGMARTSDGSSSEVSCGVGRRSHQA